MDRGQTAKDVHAFLLRIPSELHEPLRVEAFENRDTFTAIILDALRHRLKHRIGKRPRPQRAS